MSEPDWASMPDDERPSHLRRLNPQQFDAVTHQEGPLLILAGAGSGKTRVLTRRVAHLLQTGAEPESLFAVTFTNKAAAEMKERVVELVGEIGRKVWMSTFHSSCCRILRLEAEALGYTQRFAIYDDDDQLRVLRQIVLDLGYDKKVVVPKAILGRIDHYKNRLITVDDLVRTRRAPLGDPLVRIWREYEAALQAADAVDFNDLIGLTVRLFDEHEDILDKYREQFQYVMVDEYQDTNKAQYRLLRALTLKHRNLAVVGDDDQSIYGFRGADISNILNFESDFPDATIVRMEQNYRCTQYMLAVANAVVEKNEDRIVKRLWTETKGGPLVSFLVHGDPREEARAIATAIKHLRRRGTTYGDVAVIYRTNATSQPFEAAFSEASIPYKVVGGRQFYARREIRDALCFLRLLVNPNDDAAFLRVVNVPPRGIGTVTVTKLREEAGNRGEPLFKTARSISRGSDRMARSLKGFVELIDQLTDLAQSSSLPALVQETLQRSGYVAMLREEDTREAKGRLENLSQLLKDAAGFEPDEDAPEAAPHELLHQWLDRIALAGTDEEIPDGGVVTLMTVHTSKGLEFPVVMVVQMVEGRFPHSRSVEEDGGVDEERRLAYVAFTRAQKRLVVSRVRNELTSDPQRPGHYGLQPVAPSRFLFGIPLEACAGDLPGEGDDELVPTTSGRQRKLGPTARRNLRGVIARHTEEPVSPEGVHTVVELESAEQLRPGVRVLHSKMGVGIVDRVSGPRVIVRFGSRTRMLGLGDGRLQLLMD